MKIIKGIIAAFSMYSRIPMPNVDMEEVDINQTIIFLPMVGMLIGIVEFSCFALSTYVNLPVFVRTLIFILVPIILTGGFHIDGYLDTKDALASFLPREKKLEILKDPHVGSFAVIGLITNGLFMAAGLYVICDSRGCMLIMSAIFVISRAFTAMTSIIIPKAKNDGMLTAETKAVSKGGIAFVLVVLLCAVFACFVVNTVYALSVTVSFVIFTLIYRHTVMKSFGGVSGDTAGYYTVVSEVCATAFLAIAYVVMNTLKG